MPTSLSTHRDRRRVVIAALMRDAHDALLRDRVDESFERNFARLLGSAPAKRAAAAA